MNNPASGKISSRRCAAADVQLNDVEPVNKSSRKRPLFTALKVAVRASDDPGVGDFGVRADALKRHPRHAQKFCLKLRRHFTDLVEENGPAIRQLEGRCAGSAPVKAFS
jgi:hypothetical protein